MIEQALSYAANKLEKFMKNKGSNKYLGLYYIILCCVGDDDDVKLY